MVSRVLKLNTNRILPGLIAVQLIIFVSAKNSLLYEKVLQKIGLLQYCLPIKNIIFYLFKKALFYYYVSRFYVCHFFFKS